jgi:hypothetical protein
MLPECLCSQKLLSYDCAHVNILHDHDRGYDHDYGHDYDRDDHDGYDCDDHDDYYRDGRDGHDDRASFFLYLNELRNILVFLVPNLILIGLEEVITIILNRTNLHASCLFGHKFPSLTC